MADDVKKLPGDVSHLQRLIGNHAADRRMPPARLQRWLNAMIVTAVLDRVRDEDGEPIFLLKGGLAMELRLQLRARATGDYDAAFRARTEDAIDRLDEALAALESLQPDPRRVRDNPQHESDAGSSATELQGSHGLRSQPSSRRDFDALLRAHCLRPSPRLPSIPMSVSRNSPCPCGSGLKYKRCCLAAAERAKQGSRLDDEVGQRIQEWASRELSDEIGAALEQFAGRDHVMDDTDVQIFTTWFHNDRELRGGGTPAEWYAARPELHADERAVASRIAAARLRIHRVLAVEPGVSLLLEDVVGGGRVEVGSENVSRDAVRWDMLIGRVMDGDPPTLWGPVRVLDPADESGLIVELERLVGDSVSSMRDRAAHVFRAHALELMRYRPPRWDVESSFFTVEGDPIVQGSATWSVRDLREVRERFRVLGRLAPHDPLEMDITASRDRLVAERPQLPEGAIVIEASAGGLDTISVATLRLEGEHLSAEAMSEERLDHAIEIVAKDFDQLVELSHRKVVPIEPLLAEHRQAPSRAGERSSSGLPPAEERRIVAEFMTEYTRKWLDEPHPQLGGCTPRHAAAGEHRAELISLVRGIENRSERARRDGDPFADVAWIREELELDLEDLAA